MLGWENVFHCEINPFGRAVLDYWFPNSASYEDITKTDFTGYRGTIDVLTGGFPCQPFSYAGKRGGQSDDRYLWPEMLRVIDEVRPTWVIGENVAGITTMVESCEVTDMGGEATLFEEGDGVHRYRSEHTFTIERICRDLESKGYSVQPMLIPACGVGAPHRRDRVFIIAYSTSCGSEPYSQNGGTEGNGGREYAQQGERREQTEFYNGFPSLSRFAPNANCGDDVRIPGEHEGKSETQRIQERNEIRKSGESSDVQSSNGVTVEDTMCDGCRGRQEKEQGDKRNERDLGTGDSERICGEERTDIADTDSCRQCPSESNNKSTGEESLRQPRDFSFIGVVRHGTLGDIARLFPGERWKGFPTVSPIHRGNDGLPFDVDDLTIPFAKWRNESLKAYGNAIVPQVVYQIMKCIEEIEYGNQR